MIKIGILGANGQVGTEVAFYLSLHEDVDVLCLIRSEYSAALLKILSIPYLVADYADTKKMSRLLSSFDVVLDFSYQTGQVSDILGWLKKHVRQIVGCMRPRSQYIYMSSIMAYGMPNPPVYLKNYSLPRTVYAHTKRCAETLARKMGKKHRVDVFNFRLGQVHGSLQGVTQLFLSELSQELFRVNGTPQSLTNAVFTYSISESILRCIQGQIVPGTYTVVSSPQWTSEALFNFYQNKYGLRARIEYVDAFSGSRTGLAIGGWVFDKIRTFRDLAETYLLIKSPTLSFKIKGIYRVKMASAEISRMRSEREVYPMLLGPVPDRPAPVVANVDSSADKVAESMRKFEDSLNDGIAAWSMKK